MGNPGDDNEHWRLGGMLLSRKIDVVAFAALFLSISTAIYQLSAFLRGAELKLQPPDQVFILRDASYTDKKPRARFGATLNYVNRGEKGYSGIIRREVVNIAIGGKNREQGWDSFVTFGDGTTGIELKNPQPAIPFVIDGGDSKTHQTYFIAWPKHCPSVKAGSCDVLANHIYWDEFIDELKRQVAAGRHQFKFTFAAEVIDGSPIVASCMIDIDAAIVGAIERFQQYNPTCFAK